MAKPLNYSGLTLDRAAALRRDEAWVANHLAHRDTRVLPVWWGRNLVHLDDTETGAPEAVFLTGAPAQTLITQADAVVMAHRRPALDRC